MFNGSVGYYRADVPPGTRKLPFRPLTFSEKRGSMFGLYCPRMQIRGLVNSHPFSAVTIVLRSKHLSLLPP